MHLNIQTLIGKNYLDFYTECLLSLLKNYSENLNILIHLSERFTDADLILLGDNLNCPSLSFRDTASNAQQTLDYLRGYPNCQNFRINSFWATEFFDPIFAFPNDIYSYYIDADILFIKAFNGLFDPNFITGGAIFLKDTQWDAYSLRPWHLMGFNKKIDVVKGITTALVCWDKSAIDWDFLEWFLGQDRFHKIPEWVMPTAQAALAAQCDAKTVQHLQIMNMYPNAEITKQTFGLHLLGSYREKWLSSLGEYHYSNDQDPVSTQFESCEIQSTIGFSIRQAKRWMNTRLNLW